MTRWLLAPRPTCGRWAAIAAALLGAVACAGGTGGGGDGADTTAAADPASAAQGATGATGTPPDMAGGGWVALIDPELRQWRGFKRQDAPGAWTVQGDTLVFTPVDDKRARGDLVTREQYGDFELELEWKVSEGGNSGVIYRADESQDQIWKTGPEMQVLDNARHPDGKIPTHTAGAVYDLYVPSSDATRPAGEWNQARIVARGPQVEHWLNGTKVAEYDVGSEDWKRRVAASKFAEHPGWGTLPRGHIALQDHDDRVWYRNIRVRPLGGAR